jgi:hypothetical protein
MPAIIKSYPVFNFQGLTKVLVTTGFYDGSNKIEVIDLANSANECQPSVSVDYPYNLVSGLSFHFVLNNSGFRDPN